MDVIIEAGSMINCIFGMVFQKREKSKLLCTVSREIESHRVPLIYGLDPYSLTP